MITEIINSLGDTFKMLGISLGLSILFGLPIGLILFITSNGLFLQNKVVNVVGSFIVNVIRSIPFVILLVLVLPLTKAVTGTTIGSIAASVPLSIASIAFFARIVDGAFREIDPGVIEAAIAIGAKPWMIIRNVLLVEGFASLIRGLTVTAISLLGYTAMAGIVGGGGIGDLAIRFGYYRYQTDVMIITVVILVIIVQLFQIVGDLVSNKVTSSQS